MAGRISWDEYETALLIDACCKYNEGKMSRETAISNVSKTLRKRGLNKGIEIDEVFRNENGISMQFTIMNALLLHQKSGLHGASKLFKDMALMYEEDKGSYEKILQEAKGVDGVNATLGDVLSSTNREEELIELIIKHNVPYIDNRMEDGCLWIMGGHELDNFVKLCQVRLGVTFHHIENDVPRSDGNARWWTMISTGQLTNNCVSAEHVQEEGNVTASTKGISRTLDIVTFRRWLVTNGMGERSSINYSFAVIGAENYAREHGYDEWHLYGCEFPETKPVVERLFNDNDFLALNAQSHDFFCVALKKFMHCLSGEDWKPELESRKSAIRPQKIETVSEDQETLAPYNAILLERFPKGYRIGSNLDMKRFLRYYEEIYGIHQDVSDEDVKQTTRKRILQVGISHDEYVFAIDSLVDEETKIEIIKYIEHSFADGAKALYYRTLFTEFNETFLNQRIYDEDMLRTYLMHVLDGKYFFERNYISQVSSVQIGPVEEVRNLLIEHVMPMKKEKICNALPYIPNDRVEWVLGANKEFIRNERGKYFHVSVVDLTDEELDDIARIIEEGIEVRHFISGNELIDSINRKYPHLLERFSQFSVMGIRDAIAFFLSGRFSFNGNVISAIGKNMSMADVFADFARDHASFTIDELNVLKNELNCAIYFDAVYDNSLRVSQQLFVSRERANFEVEKTDLAIGRFCTGNYIALKEVTSFGSLPYVGFPWNIYLLEHYVASFSREYKLLHTKFNADNCVGAIVKRNSGINEFNDLLVDILAHSGINLTPKDALQYLYDRGLLAKRKFSDIDRLLTKARAQKG